MVSKIPKRILPIIVFSQFAGTSLWFAGNAIIGDLQSAMNVGIEDTGIVTSAITTRFYFGYSNIRFAFDIRQILSQKNILHLFCVWFYFEFAHLLFSI